MAQDPPAAVCLCANAQPQGSQAHLLPLCLRLCIRSCLAAASQLCHTVQQGCAGRGGGSNGAGNMLGKQHCVGYAARHRITPATGICSYIHPPTPTSTHQRPPAPTFHPFLVSLQQGLRHLQLLLCVCQVTVAPRQLALALRQVICSHSRQDEAGVGRKS